MPAPPARSHLSGAPTNAQFNTGIGALHDYLLGLLGSSGNAADARAALGITLNPPVGVCRAWVNFNGTGTVAIRASGNVSSITDNGVGDYTVNFATAMPDANYVVTASARISSGFMSFVSPTTFSINSIRLSVPGLVNDGPFHYPEVAGAAPRDAEILNIAIFC
jgi:hypothetical protein